MNVEFKIVGDNISHLGIEKWIEAHLNSRVVGDNMSLWGSKNRLKHNSIIKKN